MMNFEQITLEEASGVSGKLIGSLLFPDTSSLTQFKNFSHLYDLTWKRNHNISAKDNLPTPAIKAGAILYAFLAWCSKTKKTSRDAFLNEYDPEEPILALDPLSFRGIDLNLQHDVFQKTEQRGWYTFLVGDREYTMPSTFEVVSGEDKGDKESADRSKETALDRFIRGAESMMGSQAAKFKR
jgi:hypothetical protein